jgi:hypothetical protein
MQKRTIGRAIQTMIERFVSPGCHGLVIVLRGFASSCFLTDDESKENEYSASDPIRRYVYLAILVRMARCDSKAVSERIIRQPLLNQPCRSLSGFRLDLVILQIQNNVFLSSSSHRSERAYYSWLPPVSDFPSLPRRSSLPHLCMSIPLRGRHVWS